MARFSIITPTYDTDAAVLLECLESVRDQTFGEWEHVLVDDASPSPQVVEILRAAAAADPRVRVVCRDTNGGIVAASNDGLAAATGEIIVLLDHDDRLAPTALERIDEAFTAVDDEPDDVDYVYSDEDVIHPTAGRVDPFYKPDWSPERFRNQMYTCHVSAFRAAMLDEVGGFREGFDGSQDWDLVLRVTERARRIVHIPEVLYHWRIVPASVLSGEDVKPYAYVAARNAVAEHAARMGIDAEVVERQPRGYFNLVRRHREHPLVSIVIPTRCSVGLVWGTERVMAVEAVRSIVDRSTWPEFEIIAVVDQALDQPLDHPADQSVLDEMTELAGGRLTIVPWDRPFNFSDKCNLGALHARGEHLVFLNDDTQVIDGTWLDVLVGFTREDDVGAAGLQLLFEDGRVQHAGHVLLGGNPGHLMFGQFPDDPRNRSALALDREVSGVTAACLAIRASVFDEVGGFSPLFAGNYNDVDLCQKIRAQGYRIVVSAQASLYHFESLTRDPTVSADELELLRSRWWPQLNADPYYNPNYGSSFDNYPSPVRYP